MPPSPSINRPSAFEQRAFWGFAGFSLLLLLLGIALDFWSLWGLPFALLLVGQTLHNYRLIFFMLLACLPLSTEIYLSDSLAVYLPTEPLTVGLLLVFLLRVLGQPKALNHAFLRHPITLLLLLHWLWIWCSTLFSQDIVLSLKFGLAKTWFLATFFFLSGELLQRRKHLRLLLWLILVPLTLATLKVILHHASLSFGFKEINAAVEPFFRNHVNYAALLSLFLPFIWYMLRWTRWFSLKGLFLLGAFGILSFGVLTAYTRAAYIALFLAFAAYFVIKLRLMRYVLLLALLGIIGLGWWLANDNRYLELAPTERTIAHKEFDAIVEATYKLEDVSTMERYYRWVAGLRMSAERPLIGYGPNNFYQYYQQHSLNRFRTYVSDNPERSGIHNYFLMTLVEQGLIGLLLFLAFNFYLLLRGEWLYHQLKDPWLKQMTLAVLLSLVVINAFLLINDLLEVDKIGGVFFLNAALLILIEQQRTQSPPPDEV